MDDITATNADKLFINAYQRQQSMDNLSNSALSAGIDAYQKKDYKEAARAFKRTIDLAPQSVFASDAGNYLAMSYRQLGEPDKAIEAYKRWIQLKPEDPDPHVKVGKLYFAQSKYKDAEREFSEAVRLDPTRTENRYSLGQAYLFLDRFDDAEAQFRQVKRMEPKETAGYYGLGLAYGKEGRHERAIELFDEAIRLDREFYDAYAEKGYAYADMGEIDKAEEIFEFLDGKDDTLADLLSRYIYKVDPPKMTFAVALESTFSYHKPRNTPVSALDSYLANADASKSFTMVFQFDKKMDRASVEDRFNWQVGRAGWDGSGSAYNFGLSVPDTEVKLTSFPDYVYYDADQLRATVHFTIQQNSSADGTIDPSHIAFKFLGEGTGGLAMDEEADQFTGFSGVFWAVGVQITSPLHSFWPP